MNTRQTIRETGSKWATSDYYLASFLLAKGFPVLGLDDSHPRKRFIISDPDPVRREDITADYRLGVNDEVSATRLFAAQKRLQWMLRDGR
jgi:hypothetical protein